MAKKKPTKKKTASKDSVPFETSLESLRGILEQLEEGNLPLDESLEKYEKGIRHLRNCHDSLKKAKTRIELLINIDKEGQPVTQTYDHSATFEDVPANEVEEIQDELNEESEDWDGGLF